MLFLVVVSQAASFGCNRGLCRDAKAAFQRRREKVYMIEEGGVNSVECNRLHPDFGVAKAIFSLRKIHIPNLEVALSISCGELLYPCDSP